MVDEFCLKMPDFHVTFWDLLHAVNLRHETSGFTSPPKEGVLRIFIDMKNPKASVGFEPANLGTKGQDDTSRAPKPLLSTVSVHYCHQSNGFYSLPFLYAWGKPSINNIYRSAAIWWRYVVLYARYFPQNLVSMALRVGVHEFPPKKRHRSHHHVPGARRVTWSVFHTAERHFQTAQRFLLLAVACELIHMTRKLHWLCLKILGDTLQISVRLRLYLRECSSMLWTCVPLSSKLDILFEFLCISSVPPEQMPA